MPLSLICACGARIELEDALAGQEVACPECQQPLKTPAAAQSQPMRTSGFALASLILAITGAFTVVGTLAAIVLGLIALALILRQRDRLAGFGFAISGIAIGVVFTALTVVAFTKAEPFGFAGYVRERNMAPFVQTNGPLEVVEGGRWAITRPTEQWGLAPSGQVPDPLADVFLSKSRADVLLVQIKHNGFIDVHEESDAGKNLATFQKEYLDEYEEDANSTRFGGNTRNKEDGLMRITNGHRRTGHDLRTMPDGSPPGCSGNEAEVDMLVAGQKWVMLVRIYHNPKTKSFYVLRAYAPSRWFPQNREEIAKALDSFRFVK